MQHDSKIELYIFPHYYHRVLKVNLEKEGGHIR